MPAHEPTSIKKSQLLGKKKMVREKEDCNPSSLAKKSYASSFNKLSQSEWHKLPLWVSCFCVCVCVCVCVGWSGSQASVLPSAEWGLASVLPPSGVEGGGPNSDALSDTGPLVTSPDCRRKGVSQGGK